MLASQAQVIAEIGVNHEGSVDLAVEMVRNAALAGATAVKFQTYRAETLAAKDSPSYWDLKSEPTNSQRELFKKHECVLDEFYSVMLETCAKYNIEFMTSCFDAELLDKYEPYMQRIKISSSDLTNFSLIRKAVSFNKPLIISTGASSLSEIKQTVDFVRSNGGSELHISLLHCVLNYPCKPENANLGMISTLIDNFAQDDRIKIGYSCHVAVPEGIDCMLTAKVLGAQLIEKHFTTCRLKNGNDHYHAMTAEDLVLYRKREREILQLIGTGSPDLDVQNQARINARRGIYASRELNPGDILKPSDIQTLRPLGEGISAQHYYDILGKKIVIAKNKGELIKHGEVN